LDAVMRAFGCQELAEMTRQIIVTTYRLSVPSSSSTVRIHLTWSQRRAFVLTVAAFQALVWADALLNDGRYGGSWKTALAGVVLCAMALATWWIGISLTHRGMVVHSVPPMVIPWHEIHEIEVDNQLGISTVVVHHGPGARRRTRLAAPTTGPLGRDAQFQDKVRVMRSFWAGHRDNTRAA
jgi:hypothetical protein